MHDSDVYSLPQLISYFEKIHTSIQEWWGDLAMQGDDFGANYVYAVRCSLDTILSSLRRAHDLVLVGFDRIPVDNLRVHSDGQDWIVTRQGTRKLNENDEHGQ